MGNSLSGTEQIVRELEVLLRTARATAAATLLAEAIGQQAGGQPVDGTRAKARVPDDNGLIDRRTGNDSDVRTDRRSGHSDPKPSADGQCGHLSLFSLATDSRNGTQRIVVQLQGDEALYEGVATAVDFTESRMHVAARATLAAIAEWAGDSPQFGLGDIRQVSLQCGLAVLVTVAIRSGPTRDNVHRSHTLQLPEQWLIGCALQSSDAEAAAVQAVLDAVAGQTFL